MLLHIQGGSRHRADNSGRCKNRHQQLLRDKLGGDGASSTTAILLINKGAQCLIKVTLEVTDVTIVSELQKEYPGTKARRFVNKNKDRLYSVLITFSSGTMSNSPMLVKMVLKSRNLSITWLN